MSVNDCTYTPGPCCHNRLLCLVILLFLSTLSVHAQQYDVTSFGAIGDGSTDNTTSLQKAIDSCARTGGKVYFPTGVFLSGTLYLKSHVILSFSAGATLLGTTDRSKYPYLDAGIRFYGEEWARQSLIFCKNQEAVGIEGEGVIDGQGARFPVTTTKKPDRYRDRPYLLWFAGCKNITVKGIHLRNSAYWMQHYLGCEQVHIDGINIWNHSNKNNDMMDIDGCRYVTIANVTGDSDDDGLTIKSTSLRSSEDITISNCILSSHCNALKFGTESTGGFRNIAISNCIIKPSAQRTAIYGKPDGNGGIALEIADGGIMENVSIDNIVIEGPQVPLFLRLGNRARPYITGAPVPPPGRIRNIRLSNITATGADVTGCSLTGLPNTPIEDITLSNISIRTAGSDTDTIRGWPRQIAEKETEYPEGTMFGNLPSYGLFIRHVKDLHLSGLTLRTQDKETRPGIVITDADHFILTDLDISAADAPAALYISESRNGSVSKSRPSYPTRQFCIKDKSSVNVTIEN